MEVGSIARNILIVVIIAMLIYIMVRIRNINTGGWKIYGDESRLYFIDPSNNTSVSITPNTIFFGKNKIESAAGGESVQIHNTARGDRLVEFAPKTIHVKNTILKDEQDEGRGVQIYSTKFNKVLAEFKNTDSYSGIL